MINARAAVAGAYKWGRRHGKVSNNPSNDNDLELAPVLTLAATTGTRRGELSGLAATA